MKKVSKGFKYIFLVIVLFILVIGLGATINKYDKKQEETTKIIDEKSDLIAIYIDGDFTTTFPNSPNYGVLVRCFDSSGNFTNNGSAAWDGTKWVVSVNGVYNSKFKCNAYFTESPAHWDNPGANTLLSSLKTAYSTIKHDGDSGTTTPGGVLPSSNESLRMTSDDYGTSYYFRGSADDNYVKFAGMCWRIVRITGKGDIKLILSNGATNTNPCDTQYDAADAAFARYDNTTDGLAGLSAINDNTTYNAYSGIMYGTPNSTTYRAEQANTTPSRALTNLMVWYDSKLRSYDSLIADTVWCNDKSLASKNFTRGSGSLNTGFGQEKSYYKSLERCGTGVVCKPTFVCPTIDYGPVNLTKMTASDTDFGNGNLTINSQTYKIGLLTIDEAFFIGAVNDGATSIETTFLYKNASSEAWWTMSPTGKTNAANSYYWVVNSGTEHKVEGSLLSGAKGLRPMIALNYNVTITGGTGTAADPYVINES